MDGSLPLIARVAICAIGLALLTGAGAFGIRALRRRSFAGEWAPLMSIIDGTVKSGYTRSTVKGVYLGHPVQATLTLGTTDTPGSLAVELETSTRGHDWAVVFGREQLFGTSSWHVQTKDAGLEERLVRAGVLVEVEGWPEEITVRFNGDAGKLIYCEDQPTLSPERFRDELDLLVRLEGLMRGVI